MEKQQEVRGLKGQIELLGIYHLLLQVRLTREYQHL